MGDAKKLIVAPITAQDANKIVRAIHYSGKVVNNSQLHLGVFMDGKCGGAMQFGPSLDKRKIQGLVRGTGWNDFLELNRMAFADWLPRNGESRCIAYAMRWIKKTYPWIQWVVTFADGTQCGDGTIYRASGFHLLQIKKNNQIWIAPDGEKTTRMVATDTRRPARERLLSRVSVTKVQEIMHTLTIKGARSGTKTVDEVCKTAGGGASMKKFIEKGWRALPGFQLKYIYFIDPTARERLTVPILPYSEIEKRGAGMYKGESRAGSIAVDAPDNQSGEGGSTPTPAL